MLNYRLKLPIKKYLHPIFYTCCGVLSNMVAIFKIWQNNNVNNMKLIRVDDLKRKT